MISVANATLLISIIMEKDIIQKDGKHYPKLYGADIVLKITLIFRQLKEILWQKSILYYQKPKEMKFKNMS